MFKTAQKRSILNRIREKVNMGGEALEQIFSPDSEFLKVMNDLREKDNLVRAIITAKDIDGTSPPTNIDRSLKEILKSAKSNLNRREYMRAIADLGIFHKNMAEAVINLRSFSNNIDKVHEQFLFSGLDEGTENNLHDLKKRFASKRFTSIRKESGIMDFFSNLTTERGRALAAWEKKYPKKIRELRVKTNELLNKSESLFDNVVSILKKMATARATRKVDEYIKEASKIIAMYNSYDVFFKNYYTSQVKGFIENSEYFAPKKNNIPDLEIKTPNVSNLETKTPGTENIELLNIPDLEVARTMKSPKTETVPSISQIKTVKKIPEEPLVEKEPKTEEELAPPTEEESIPPTIRSPAKLSEESKQDPNTEISTPKTVRSAGINTFIKSLEKMANESPLILSLYIKKYANLIQKSDPKTAIKLFNIVKSIKS